MTADGVDVTRFELYVTMHRYVRGTDAETAAVRGHHGMQIDARTCFEPVAVVVFADIVRTQTLPYRHAGEGDDLWQVSVTVLACIVAVDAAIASAAAHQLITVDEVAADGDVFEFEIEIESGYSEAHQLQLAS